MSESKAEAGENEAFKASLEAFLSNWKDAGRDTSILMEGFSKGWLAHRQARPAPAEARCKRLDDALQHCLDHGHLAPETRRIVEEARNE